MCIKCEVANGFNPDAGAKFQPGDLVRIGNAKQVYSVVKCHADYAEVDAGEGSTYRIPIGYLNKVSVSSAFRVLLGWGEWLPSDNLKGGGDLVTDVARLANPHHDQFAPPAKGFDNEIDRAIECRVQLSSDRFERGQFDVEDGAGTGQMTHGRRGCQRNRSHSTQSECANGATDW